MPDQKTAIITGASRGIGAGLVGAFLKQGYNVVATSRNVSQQLTAATALVLIDGDIGKPETAAKVVEAAIKNFGGIDVLVSNAGIFFTKPFTEFSTADFNALVSTNLLGFLYITQLSVKQMLKQKSGSVVSVTAALADHDVDGYDVAVTLVNRQLRGQRLAADTDNADARQGGTLRRGVRTRGRMIGAIRLETRSSLARG